MIEEYTPVRRLPQRSALALPPNQHGWHRRRDDRGSIMVRVPNDHPLVTSNGWILEARLTIFESGREFYPGDRIFHLDRDPANNTLDNLVIVKPGDPYPWPHKTRPCACGCGQALPVSGPKPRKYVTGHQPKINDQFSQLPVSRQRQCQLRWKSQGRCSQCGKQPLVTANHCARCLEKVRMRYDRMRRTDPKRYERYLARANTCARKWARQHKGFVDFYRLWYQRFKSRHGGLGKKCWPAAAVAEFKELLQSYKTQQRKHMKQDYTDTQKKAQEDAAK